MASNLVQEPATGTGLAAVAATEIEKNQQAQPEPSHHLAFDGDDDPDDPVNWSQSLKWTIVAVLAMMSLAGNMATIMCAPAVPQILANFGSNSTLYSTALVSIWELGEGVGPLLIGPLSEIYGRLLAYNAANITFLVFNGLAAGSTSLGMLIAMRFFNGFGVACVNLNPAIIGDLFVQEERGRAMSIINLPPLLGPVCGPIIAGYLQARTGWRWVFGFTALLGVLCEVLFLVFFRETYSVVILRRRAAARLRQGHRQQPQPQEPDSSQLDQASLQARHDPSDPAKPTAPVVRALLQASVVRPLRLLFRSPIVACLAVYLALVYGYIYILFTTLTNVFETVYNFPSSNAGLPFLGIALGIVLGVVFCSFTLDRIVRVRKAAGKPITPEQRLPPMALGSIVLVAGLFMYGWTAQARVHWIAPIIGSGLVGAGLVLTMIPSATYLVDAYPLHGASAMAAIGVLRSLAAAGLPLVGPPLFDKLGLDWGSSVLGFVASAFVPGAFLLMLYGERLRNQFKDPEAGGGN